MKLKIKLIALLISAAFVFIIGLDSAISSTFCAAAEEAYWEQKTEDTYDDAVEIYRETVTIYCSTYSIPEYIDVVMKMLSFYSSTHTSDIMNSSYSYLNDKYEHKNEGIVNIDYSLRVGIIQLSEWSKYIKNQYGIKPIEDYYYLSVLLEAYELQDKNYIDYALTGKGYSASDVIDYCNSKDFSSEKGILNINNYFAAQVINMLTIISAEANDIQKRIIELATDYSNYSKNGISTKGGYCLKFSNDILTAAGLNIKRTDCARCAGTYFGVSNDFSHIPIGAEIYCYSSQQYGHVGIYIGDGYVVHCINYKSSGATILLTVDNGYVMKEPLSSFISSYKGACWGFSGAWSDQYPYQPGQFMTSLH